MTFSINSVCHIKGRRPFKTKDRSQNVWWLALPVHGRVVAQLPSRRAHLGPSRRAASEIDSSAVLIRLMEKLRWVGDVRWPEPDWMAAGAWWSKSNRLGLR